MLPKNSTWSEQMTIWMKFCLKSCCFSWNSLWQIRTNVLNIVLVLYLIKSHTSLRFLYVGDQIWDSFHFRVSTPFSIHISWANHCRNRRVYGRLETNRMFQISIKYLYTNCLQYQSWGCYCKWQRQETIDNQWSGIWAAKWLVRSDCPPK